MKVTALMPDELVEEVRLLAHGRTITESLIIAMKEWVAMKKLEVLNSQLLKTPLQFQSGFSAACVRELNRHAE